MQLNQAATEGEVRKMPEPKQKESSGGEAKSKQVAKMRALRPGNNKSPYFVLFDSWPAAFAGDVAFPARIGSLYLNLQSYVDARCSTSSRVI